jgi:hypothetical protein
VWSGVVNATASGGTLTKTSGCNGCDDAGGVTTTSIPSGDGALQFNTVNASDVFAIGIVQGNPGTRVGSITQQLRFNGGNVAVYEFGAYKADTTYGAGSVFQIQIASGKVNYVKNGTTFFSSALQVPYPLSFDASLWSPGATVANAQVNGSGSSGGGPGPGGGGGGPGSSAAVSWTAVVNATANGPSLTKTSGCNGCDDAGGVTAQTLASGNGALQFSTVNSSDVFAIGITQGNPGTRVGSITQQLRFNGGNVGVYEFGAYKADTTYGAGSVFQIQIASGNVNYVKNGTTFFSSALQVLYPLSFDASLWSPGATVSNAQFTAGP